MAFELLTFASDMEVARAAADDWLREIKPALHRNQVYTVALSGGRIAKLFCAELAARIKQLPVTEKQAFDRQFHFFWADERCVPPTDPECNYAIARQLLFEPAGIPESQIHRLRGEEPEPLALRDALENINRWTNPANGVPVLDIIFLGMGEDGHVASLFPGESDAVMNDKAVYRAVTAVKPPPRRVTLGYPVIAAAKSVRVLVTGAGKEDALRVSTSPDGRTPLARVLRSRGHTRILTDIQTK